MGYRAFSKKSHGVLYVQISGTLLLVRINLTSRAVTRRELSERSGGAPSWAACYAHERYSSTAKVASREVSAGGLTRLLTSRPFTASLAMTRGIPA